MPQNSARITSIKRSKYGFGNLRVDVSRSWSLNKVSQPSVGEALDLEGSGVSVGMKASVWSISGHEKYRILSLNTGMPGAKMQICRKSRNRGGNEDCLPVRWPLWHNGCGDDVLQTNRQKTRKSFSDEQPIKHRDLRNGPESRVARKGSRQQAEGKGCGKRKCFARCGGR